jgi:hypothetical protein
MTLYFSASDPVSFINGYENKRHQASAQGNAMSPKIMAALP